MKDLRFLLWECRVVFLFVFACAIKQVFLFVDESGEFFSLEDTI
jgi:hypothetical protein